MAIGFASVMVFNLVDTWFAGRLGTDELAAMGFTFPVIALIASANMGLGVGATALASRLLGARQRDEARRFTRDALLMALAIIVVVSTVGLATIDVVFGALGAEGVRLDLVREYMSIWYLAVIVVTIPQVGNAILRATGDSRTPAVTMTIAAVVNIGLDPLLMFGVGPFPRMGLRGAAIATVIARGIAALISLWVLARRDRLLTFERPRLRPLLRNWADTARLGLPAAGAQAMSPLALGAATAVTARFGPEAVGAYGAGTRVAIIALLPAIAVSTAMTPFIGQNIGAGLGSRVRGVIRLGGRFAWWYGLGAWAVLLLAAPAVASAFTDDAAVADGLTLFLRLGLFGLAGEGAVHVVAQAHNGMHLPLRGATLTAIRLLALFTPAVILGAEVAGLTGTFVAMSVANLAAGAIAVWFSRTLRRRVPEDARRETVVRVGAG